MQKVMIYKTQFCPFCKMATKFFEDKRISFEEVDLSADDELREKIISQTGMRTVPQIFIGDHFVGGHSELLKLSKEELDNLLK